MRLSPHLGRVSPLLTLLRGFLVLLVVLGASEREALAESPDVEKCFSAYEQTQIKLKEKKFTDASEIAKECSSGCPSEINDQCKSWARVAEREVPTVLLFARFEDGKDAPGVTVTVDGEPRNLRKELPLDPGLHRIVFQGPDDWSETLDVDIFDGEKRRAIRATVPKAKKIEPEPPPVVAEKRDHTARNWAIVSFSVGAVGVGVASTATLMALSRKSDLDACSPACSPTVVREQTDKIKTTLLVADVGAALGAVGILSGIAIVIWGNPKETQAPRGSVSLAPMGRGVGPVIFGQF